MDRCEACEKISSCTVCGHRARGFDHTGVRASTIRPKDRRGNTGFANGRSGSGIWHFAKPCGHRIDSPKSTPRVKYNGGPLWKEGYTWQNIYWGNFFASPSSSSWIDRTDQAVMDIESNTEYSGGLSVYDVGIGKVVPHVIIKSNPPSRITDLQIKQSLTGWISQGTVSNIGEQGAYNIFLPKDVTVLLSALEASCKVFCDYHNSANGARGPFYTVEPYPCTMGCNRCTNDPFDTLTQGLSEEMVELKTDMDPGTGWVIGNEEICDYCDVNFVCNKISSGQHVNSWYDKGKNACWKGAPETTEAFTSEIEAGKSRLDTGS